MIRLACCILLVCSTLSAEHVKVRTSLGEVRGKLVHDELTGTSYYSYTGIPYAQPPVGELRFQPPIRRRPWRSVFDATKPGRVCPQRETYYSRDQMSEDCLVFNVYSPANTTNKLMPVIFYLHGGRFDSLSGNAEPIYGPQLLVRDSVVVTLNYRLGALGFLSLCNEEVSGNAGLKDAILALKIVHENISKFGGDPNKITVSGNGAGATLVQWLLLTNETKGLIFGGTFCSGSILSSQYTQLSPRRNSRALARELNIKYTNDADLIKQLQCVDAFDIVKAQEAMIKKDPKRGFRISSPFMPTVEANSKTAVITESPLTLMRTGATRDVPLLVSFNDQEGAEILAVLKQEPELINKFNENFELLIPEEFQYPVGSEARRKLAARIRDFYFDGGNITLATVQNYINLISDTHYLYPIDQFVKRFVNTKTSPLFYGLFAADTELNYVKALTKITYPGNTHDDVLGYLFVTDVTKPKFKSLSSEAKGILDLVSQVFKSFTYNGKPLEQPGVWPEAGPGLHHVAIYNYATVPVYHRPYPERMAFWDAQYNELYNAKGNVGSYFCTNDDIRSVQ